MRIQRIFTIARLTVKSAFRYRLVQVLLVLLVGAVVALPAIIKHDGTAQGFIQIVLTYTLGSITTLLGFATLWLACGTLARDIEECQMQMVVVKPIARWEIWLGKWLGIMALNVFLLAVSGAAIYGLMQFRALQLPAETQAKLRNEVLVARAAVREPVDYAAIDEEVEHRVQERLKDATVSTMDVDFVRRQVREQIKAQFQVVPPGMVRRRILEFKSLANRLRDKPLFIRTRFFTPEYSEKATYLGLWEVGPVNGRRFQPEPIRMAGETFYEIQIAPNLFDAEGNLVVDFMNANESALLFPLEDGVEVLYPESSYAVNFMRGLGIIACWLALLASIGLAASSFLSFPVAAFASLAVLIVGLSSGTVKQVVEEGGVAGVNPDTGMVDVPGMIDFVAVPVFRGLLAVLNLVQGFSPIDALSSGRSVTWGQLFQAVTQIVVLLGGIFAAVGIGAFARRELATAQGTQ